MPLLDARPTDAEMVVEGGGVGVDWVGERRGLTGDTAEDSNTGDTATGVGVVGLLPPFCSWGKQNRRTHL